MVRDTGATTKARCESNKYQDVELLGRWLLRHPAGPPMPFLTRTDRAASLCVAPGPATRSETRFVRASTAWRTCRTSSLLTSACWTGSATDTDAASAGRGLGGSAAPALLLVLGNAGPARRQARTHLRRAARTRALPAQKPGRAGRQRSRLSSLTSPMIASSALCSPLPGCEARVGSWPSVSRVSSATRPRATRLLMVPTATLQISAASS